MPRFTVVDRTGAPAFTASISPQSDARSALQIAARIYIHVLAMLMALDANTTTEPHHTYYNAEDNVNTMMDVLQLVFPRNAADVAEIDHLKELAKSTERRIQTMRGTPPP